MAGEVGDAGCRAARGQGRARPARDHEPGQAAPGRLGLDGAAQVDRAGLLGVLAGLARDEDLAVGGHVGGDDTGGHELALGRVVVAVAQPDPLGRGEESQTP